MLAGTSPFGRAAPTVTLLNFHRFLIVCGILFCLGYAGWETRSFLRGGGGGALALVVAFGVLAALLASYLWHLDRWLGYDEDGPGRGSRRD